MVLDLKAFSKSTKEWFKDKKKRINELYFVFLDRFDEKWPVLKKKSVLLSKKVWFFFYRRYDDIKGFIAKLNHDLQITEKAKYLLLEFPAYVVFYGTILTFMLKELLDYFNVSVEMSLSKVLALGILYYMIKSESPQVVSRFRPKGRRE